MRLHPLVLCLSLSTLICGAQQVKSKEDFEGLKIFKEFKVVSTVKHPELTFVKTGRTITQYIYSLGSRDHYGAYLILRFQKAAEEKDLRVTDAILEITFDREDEHGPTLEMRRKLYKSFLGSFEGLPAPADEMFKFLDAADTKETYDSKTYPKEGKAACGVELDPSYGRSTIRISF